jgi:hypothetical protein
VLSLPALPAQFAGCGQQKKHGPVITEKPRFSLSAFLILTQVSDWQSFSAKD